MVNLQVSLQMALYNIVDMDAKRQVGNDTKPPFTYAPPASHLASRAALDLIPQTITTNCEVITSWHDVFLTWNPEE